MRRLVILLLPLLAFAVGCSNRPLAGLLDCFFPSRGTRPPSDLPRPTDSDPLPPVPGFDPRPSGGDGFRRDDLPRIGDPVGPDGRRPTENEVPFTREPTGGAMPLPGGR
jgi:hypothetical protein